MGTVSVRLFSDGIPEGTRNIVMFAAAVGAKKEQPEKWRERLEEINVKYCTPSAACV